MRTLPSLFQGRPLRLLVVVLLAGTSFISAFAAFANFITRTGGTIKDGAATFDFIGINTFDVTHLRTDLDLRQGQRMRAPTGAEIDYLVKMAAVSHAKVIRTWCFASIYEDTHVPYHLSFFYKNTDNATVTLNEEAFVRFDYLIKACEANNIRLQIPFLYTWVWAAGDGTPHAQFKDLISKVLNRTNTLTGVQYKNDKTIYCWESANEINPSDTYITALAAYVKGIDTTHLFMDGRNNAQDIYDNYYTDTILASDANIDLVSYHTYNETANGWSAATTLANLNTRLTTYNKALDIGEFSPNDSVSTLTSYLDALDANNVHSGSYWAWQGIKAQGGYMQWNGSSWGATSDLKWPGFVSALTGVSTEKDKVDTLVGHAYSIEGGSRPAVPVPLPAHLRPIRDSGHISWEPGVGEQTADIERSTDGTNFSVIKSGFETFKSGHTDLFADTGVSLATGYYYRIRSKNSSGNAASYSNRVGPVTPANLWLVDDLWDTTKMASASGGCVISSSYSAVTYHCDLSYLSSSGGAQNAVYNVAGNANQITVVANNDTNTLTIEGSVSGSTYAAISLKRILYPALHPEFSGHPRVLYESSDLTSAGYRFLRINFGASDVISRVEISHSGAAAPLPTEYIIDNSDAGFATVGAWTTATTTSAEYGVPHFLNGNFVHDGDSLAGGSKSATWTSPISTTGVYDVFMRWTGGKNDTSRPATAPVEVNFDGGVANLTVNQRNEPGAWNYLWTWSFTGGSGDYVKITDASAGITVADSVRWVRVLGADDFADGNDTGWTKIAGIWSIVSDSGSNAFDQSSTSGEPLASYGNTAWQDYSYEADVKVTAEGAGATGPGLVFRYVDSNNLYLFQLRRSAGVVRLWKKQAGTWTQIGSDEPFTSAMGMWCSLRVELAGTSIRCYVNDCKLIDTQDSTFKQGAVGFRTGNTAARIDNVHVK